jgi:hypothetical protein
MDNSFRIAGLAALVTAASFLGGCSGTTPSFAKPAATAGPTATPAPTATPVATATPATSLLANMHTLVTIGSTVDPLNGDGNPYGLAIAPVSAGLVTAGDLIVCNFNDGPTNTQGNGTTIVGLHPVVGSTPYRIAQGSTLRGCDALSTDPTGNIWTADFNANDNAEYSPSGTLLDPFSASATFAWSGPWGEIYAPNSHGPSAFYVSNAGDGSVDRLALSGTHVVSFTPIASGFSVNHGQPGSIFAPAGLTYDPALDTLYVVDTNANTVSAIAKVSTLTAPSAASVKIIASGAPLNGPLSAALLPNGNVIVGNTLDPDGTNLLVEVSPTAGILTTKNVDTGPAGALFGIVATGTVSAPKIFLNDDNTNSLLLLSN